MKRIKPTGCGYSITGQTYTCTPIKKLHPFFAHTYVDAYAAETIRDTGTHTPDQYDNPDWIGDEADLKQGSIDNYVQLPQTFEGFVMTLTPIIDMSGSETGPEVAELDCRVNFDPFTKAPNSVLNNDPDYTAEPDTVNDGFLNLYNNVDPQYLENVYVDAKESTQLIHGSTTQPYYKMTPYLRGRTDYVAGVGYRIVDPNDGVRVPLYAGPGILEPMLDTSFPAIGVDTITSSDIIGDFTMWEFNTLSQWQKTVDGRLNALNAKIPVIDYGGIDGLLNLENNKNKKSPCSNFNISIASRLNPLIKRIPPRPAEKPVYSVGGGTILINGATVDVTGIDGIEAPTEIYLDVEPVVEGGVVTGHTASVQAHSSAVFTRAVGHKYVYIGRVAVSNNQDSGLPDFGDGYPFTLYEIQQGECIYTVDMPKEVEKDEYPGPFVVRFGKLSEDPADPDELYVTGFDSDGSTSDVYAGKIYINGVFSTLKKAALVDVSTPGSFVYAHVSLTKTDIGYVYSGCEFSCVDVVEPSDENTLIYTFRLARVTVDENNNIEIDQIHYGDLYVDTAIESVTPTPVPSQYLGPFRVQTGTVSGSGGDVHSLCVMGISNDSEGDPVVYYAGKIFYNGKEVLKKEAANVANTSSAPKFVYAKVDIDDSTEVPTATCAFTTDDGFAPVEGKKRYTVRLSEIKSYPAESSPTLNQIHFGDIYLYGSTATAPVPPVVEEYKGPFKVSYFFSDTEPPVASLDIMGCTDTQVAGAPAGIIYINGSSAGTLPIVLQKSIDTGATFIYAHIGLIAADGKYTIAPGSTYTYAADTAVSGADVTYHVRLARLATDEAIQVHYGDIYIDMEPQQDAPAAYRGPFTITATGVSCGICPATIVGYYRLNGTEQHSVTTNDVSVTAAAGTSTNIYLHVTGTTSAVVNTTATPTGTPPPYTVWLGQITKDANGIVTNIDQVHYGEVLVDGRWT